MLNYLAFRKFDVGGFLVCLMPNLNSNPNLNPKILGDKSLVIWREREKLDNGERERERERERMREQKPVCGTVERERGA